MKQNPLFKSILPLHNCYINIYILNTFQICKYHDYIMAFYGIKNGD